VLEQFCASFDENGILTSLPSPPPDHSWTYLTTPQRPWRSGAGSESESGSGSESGSASGSSSYASAASGSSGQVYVFGTATRSGSPAFWSPPRRPGSPMSVVTISSSPESDSEFGVRIAKPVSGRYRRGHKRFVGTVPLAMGSVGIEVGASGTTTWVS
jgi:hypothetical protein